MPSASRDGPFTISIGNTLDVVVVSPNAFHSGDEQRLERRDHERERLGLHTGHRRVRGDELDGRDSAAGGSTPTTWSGGSGVHASSASIAASVGGSSGAPSPHRSRERQLVERGRVGRHLDLLAGERHAVTSIPRSSRARRVCIGRDREQLLAGSGLERVRQHEDPEVAVPEVVRHVGAVGRELVGDDRDHRALRAARSRPRRRSRTTCTTRTSRARRSRSRPPPRARRCGCGPRRRSHPPGRGSRPSRPRPRRRRAAAPPSPPRSAATSARRHRCGCPPAGPRTGPSTRNVGAAVSARRWRGGACGSRPCS